MTHPTDWKAFWESRSNQELSDYELDRGMSKESEIERLSNQELLEFIGPHAWENVLDAGCGTGATTLLLAPKVKSIVGVDYSRGSILRCKTRIATQGIKNVSLTTGEINHTPCEGNSIDKVVCLSVLQYLDDDTVRQTLGEFARVLKDNGILVLHVKNLSSLYLSTLRVLKGIKLLLGGHTVLEYFRSYTWYVKELGAAGFEIFDYNSFDLFTTLAMPRSLVQWLLRVHLRNYKRFPFNLGFVRRHGAELKIKAKKTSKLKRP